MVNQNALEQIQNAIRAHGAWKLKLKIAVRTGETDLTPEQVKSDCNCEFGKWLYGNTIPPKVKDGTPYSVVRKLHGEFHQSASEVLDDVISGRKEKSMERLDGEFSTRSATLVRALTKWKGELNQMQ